MILCLVGDIFDLWLGEFEYFKSEYPELIGVLKEFGERNVRLLYFQGNHDLYLEDFWGAELGMEVYREPQVLEFMGKRFSIEHGDLMNPKDRGYLFLKAVLNNPIVEGAIKRLPGAMVGWVGSQMSSASRRINPHSPEHSENIHNMIRAHARKRHVQTGAEWIVTGHVHVEDLWTTQDFTSVNLGSWHQSQRILSWSPHSHFNWLEVK